MWDVPQPIDYHPPPDRETHKEHQHNSNCAPHPSPTFRLEPELTGRAWSTRWRGAAERWAVPGSGSAARCSRLETFCVPMASPEQTDTF